MAAKKKAKDGKERRDDELANLLEKAIAIATRAHAGQRDQHGKPYILHPLRVMASPLLLTDEERIVAALHDVVEDTEVTEDDLRREGFPEALLRSLKSVTRDPEESYDEFVERSAADPIGRRVKLADLTDNMDLKRARKVKDKDMSRLKRYVKAWRRLTEG